jgi:outer membrane protein assembly factor BamE (lipoprotein component of BamABCDE complex)
MMKVILALAVFAVIAAPLHSQSTASTLPRTVWSVEAQKTVLSGLKGKTRDQVIGVIGRPYSRDSFGKDSERWYYLTRTGIAWLHLRGGLVTGFEWSRHSFSGQIGIRNSSAAQEYPSSSGSDH